MESKILLLLILIPALGCLVLMCLPKEKVKLIKVTGLWIGGINLVLSQYLWVFFDENSDRFQFKSLNRDILMSFPSWNTSANNSIELLGIDGISVYFILLTTLLIPLCLLISWNSIKTLVKEYIICFLAMESALIIVFSVLDLVLFYVFFETILIPMFLVIGIWGSRTRKIRAAYQLFLYTLLGSILMLLALLTIYFEVGSTSYEIVLANLHKISPERELLLWLAFFASFAIKVPMFPVHIWLPEAHVEAPTAGSVLLAGILLKLGTYGFIRFSIPLFPNASLYFTPLIYTLSVLAIVYTSLTTLRQIDLKKIIAYSSVAHMGLVTIGLFTNNIQGIEGALLIMISHGFVSSALFMCVGVLYDRYHTRILKYYSGIAQHMPVFALLFVFFSLANLGLPGTSSFVGEFLTLVGAIQSSFVVTVLASSGMVLGAAYSIWLCNRVLFGHSTTGYNYTDISLLEVSALLPLISLTLLMGVYPSLFLNLMHLSVTHTLI